MKKWVRVLLIILVVVAVVAAVLFGAEELTTVRKNAVAYITMDGKTDKVYIVEYQRISNGWIRVVSESGVEYYLDERNIVIQH